MLRGVPDNVLTDSIILEIQILNTNKIKSGTKKSGRNYQNGRAEYLPKADMRN